MPKKDELFILSAAQGELEEIGRLHMNLVGPKSAREITERIYCALARLCDHPLMGVSFQDPELKKDGYRRLICGNYLCIYRLIGDVVYVYHIVDGRANYPRLLSDLPK